MPSRCHTFDHGTRTEKGQAMKRGFCSFRKELCGVGLARALFHASAAFNSCQKSPFDNQIHYFFIFKPPAAYF